jgi:hypothetical protein
MNTELIANQKFGRTRWLMLTLAPIVLCMSYFMAVFAPFPLTLVHMLYGRLTFGLTSLLGFALTSVIGFWFFQDFSLTLVFALAWLLSLGIAESLKRSWAPLKVALSLGAIVVILSLFFMSFVLRELGQTPRQFMATRVEEVVAKIEEMKKLGQVQIELSDVGLHRSTDDLVTDIFMTTPGLIVAGLFCLVWLNYHLALKSRRLFVPQAYQFDERSLVQFKMPFEMVYAVVVCLAVIVTPETWKIPIEVLMAAHNLLRIIGVFYLFQGLGVMQKVFDHLRLFGFMRSLSFVLPMLFVPWIFALVGLFDTWFEFDKKLQNKKSFL